MEIITAIAIVYYHNIISVIPLVLYILSLMLLFIYHYLVVVILETRTIIILC